MASLESLHVDVARLEEQVSTLTSRIDGLCGAVGKLNDTLSAHIGAEDLVTGTHSNRLTALETTKTDSDAAKIQRQNWLIAVLGASAIIAGVLIEHLRLSIGK